jgi:hypothetical protein
MSESKRRTTARILKTLSPDQLATWQSLVGEPFPYDLNWGPDNILPR